MMLLTLAVVAAVIVLLMRAARTGHEAGTAPSGHTAVAVVGDSTPDARWLGGVLYFNREDPALIVEKRFGVGYTLNFAHPAAWIIICALCCLPFVVILLTPHHR